MKKQLFNPPFLPIRRNKKFYNYDKEDSFETPEWLIPSIKMYFNSYKKRKKDRPDLSAWIEPYQGCERSKEPIITWMGHATMLIQMGNLNIMTDPILESPSFLYKRVLPFGAEPHELPAIDVVLISHNHYDHMDASTLKHLFKEHNPLFLVPEGNKSWFTRRGMERVEEFNWWQSYEHQGSTFSFVPAWHWSQRGIFDHNRTLWGGWVIETKEDSVFFAGDTAYSHLYFSTIGQMFPNLEVAIMPIGPCDPDELMRRSHMNAQEAGQAFLDCNARYFVPMHWGTFNFGVDFFHTPIDRITQWWQANQELLPPQSLVLSKLGQQFHLAHHRTLCLDMPDQNR